MKTRKLMLIVLASLALSAGACTNMNKTQQGALSGAAGGALLGTGIGAIAGDAGAGAAIGAAAGGIGGAIYGHSEEDRYY